MRFAVCCLAVLVCSVTFASEPGQPLDCSDMQFTVPGLSCVVVAPLGQPGIGFFTRGSDLVVDNEGYSVIAQQSPDFYSAVELHRSANGGQSFEVFARIAPRWDQNPQDLIRFTDSRDVQSGIFYVPNHLVFDPVHGRLLVSFVSYCAGACPGSYGGRWIAAIEGFTTLYEVRQSFAPQAPLGFRVPVMPEGMAGADSFDTYWGTLTHPIDFTQAHPLACDYPSAQPHVGDYLTVADTVPTPSPGQGVYYVTAATYQGATRYGRKTTAGHLSGRDPALLPACVP
jgi:hypothetical protein